MRSLADVARSQEETPTLRRLAQTICDEDATRVDTALATAAQQVQRECHADVLAEAAADVRREDAQALVAKVSEAEKRSGVGGGGAAKSDDGYSSFGDDDDDASAAKASASTKPRAAAQVLAADDASESDAGGPQRTTANDSPESKAFLRAVYRADVRKIQDMLDSGDASAATADQHGWSGLHWAASQGHTKVLELLLARGAAVDAVEHLNGWTALHVAAVRELLPSVKLLLKAGASLRIRDAYGDSAREILRGVRGKKRERFLQALAQFA